MTLSAAIDSPASGSLNDPLTLRLVGWLHAGVRDAELDGIEVHAGDRIIASTSIRFERPDVTRALGLPSGAASGFSVLASAPELFGRSSVRLDVHARFQDGTRMLAASREVALIAHDHRENHYGVLARPDETRIFHRSDIYTSGASVSEANPDCLALVRRYLGTPPCRVLDVGCGFGPYGRALRAEGYDWTGAEIKASDCAELARLGLPHVQLDGRSLPFADAAFDAAICIEVLEHIPDPMPFLAEIRRVIRRRLLISVPNVELIPYLHRYAAVPWHLLEGDHKNFFTRPSLRHLLAPHFRNVEVLSYAPHPLRTPEGIALDYHLFAICEI